jgi:hypothetical protein
MSAYQVESFAASVAAEMEDLGYQSRMADAVGPEVKVCMSKPTGRELCTTLQEVGQPWTIYSPSNIANIQADRYQFMYGDGGSTSTRTSSTSSVPTSFSFSNLTTGNRSLLRVGDRWTLSVTGAPNSDVTLVGGPNGAVSSTVMGRTNAAGVWSTSGSPSVAEIGNWSQQILVGGRSAGTLSFQVVAASSSQQQEEEKTTADKLADEADKQAAFDWSYLTSSPWILVAGGAAVLFLMRGKS